MAALTACDELLDANARLEKLEQELEPCATCASRPATARGRRRSRWRMR